MLEDFKGKNGDQLQIGVALWLTHMDETDGKIIFADKIRTKEELVCECEKHEIAVITLSSKILR